MLSVNVPFAVGPLFSRSTMVAMNQTVFTHAGAIAAAMGLDPASVMSFSEYCARAPDNALAKLLIRVDASTRSVSVSLAWFVS